MELTPDTDIWSLPLNEQFEHVAPEIEGETENQSQGGLDEESEVCVSDGQEEEGSEEQQTSDQVWDFVSVGTLVKLIFNLLFLRCFKCVLIIRPL